MTRPTLTVVGGKGPEADEEDAAMIARAAEHMAAAVKAGGVYWLVTADGEDVSVSFSGGKLESAVLAEAVAQDMKREAVGL